MTKYSRNNKPHSQTDTPTGDRAARKFIYSPGIIALAYALLGALWLATTDRLVESLFPDPKSYVVAQFIKGLIFIVTSSLVIYLLARRASKSLDEEINRDRLIQTKRLFDAVLASIGEAVLVIDPDGRYITNSNKAAEQLFGYTKEEMIGSGTEFLHVDKEHFNKFAELGNKELENKGVFQTEFRMKRKDGTIIETYNTVSTVHENLGWEAGVVSIIRDITESKKANEVIQQNLREKEVMIKEIHHRVKNNLSIISSLLYLQSDQIQNKQEAIDAFEKSRQRIQSMAQVHEKLYSTENMVQIDMKDYIEEMSNNLIQSIKTDNNIDLEYNLDVIHLDINRAVPCGLILNELITNALKHAFGNQKKGRINIEIHESDKDQYELAVCDNGVGLPSDLNIHEINTLGFQIINTLVDQIGGQLHIATDQGTCFQIQFPAN